MIKLTKINGSEFYMNADLMEFMESTPDTIITMTTGKKLIVLESVEDVIDRIIQYKSRALRTWEALRREDS
ncbi:MAG: flagellar FlbD family protein [Candidatus Cloacimonetes bacterium]|nr:flagellar FlbD family protein [Candidatus Cloacimonadota bacterium]